MDIDRQDPPALIEPFMAHWREGYDIVYGVRTQRTWDTTAKQVSASWFYGGSIRCRRCGFRRMSATSA